MINYTHRLDKAIRIAAWAHEQQLQHRKGTDIPYIIHPFGVILKVDAKIVTFVIRADCFACERKNFLFF